MGAVTKLFSALRLARQVCRSHANRSYLRLAHPAVDCHPSVRLGRGARLRAFAGGRIIVGAGASLGDFARVEAVGGHIEIGRNCLLQHGTIVVGCEHISIGDGTLIAEYVTIRDANHRHAGEAPLADQGLVTSPIRIGREVWLGAKVTVTSGVEIADRVVVGANAVVTRSLPERGVYAGVPARRIDRAASPGS